MAKLSLFSVLVRSLLPFDVVSDDRDRAPPQLPIQQLGDQSAPPHNFFRMLE